MTVDTVQESKMSVDATPATVTADLLNPSPLKAAADQAKGKAIDQEAAAVDDKEQVEGEVQEEQAEEDEEAELTMEDVPALIEAGSRAFALDQFDTAVDQLAQASQVMCDKFGQTAPECVDVLFMYGKALLGNAILKNGVLGTKAAPVAAVAASSSSSSVEAAPVAEAASKSAERFVFDGDAEDIAEAEEDLGLEDIGEGDSDDLELAWETLDLVRVILSKMESEDSKIKLADVYISLGDVSVESENFQQAAQDYKEALTRKTALLPADHRELAEANYKLALALEFVESIQESIECVKAAVQILELHVANHKSTDITEVECLLPDMKQKLEELIASLAKQEAEDAAEDEAEAAEDQAAEVADVSGLVKRKASEEEDASASKKEKLAEESK